MDDLAGKSFEELVELLEATLGRMESEPLTLTEAIDAYERSVAIARACNDLLDNAELRIREIDARLTQGDQLLDTDREDEDVPFD